MSVLGIDLGGTKLAGAVFAGDGAVLHRRTVPVDKRKGPEVGRLVVDAVLDHFQAAQQKNQPVGAVGICVPGISRSKTGRVWAPNIPGWDDYPLLEEVQSALADSAVKVLLDSDRACSILGEAWKGAAKECRDAIFLAVGTGIGAGIMIDGKILRGSSDIAGAIGWMALDRPFRKEYIECGCFEYHASGEGLAKVARTMSAAGVSPGTRELFAEYASGEAVARKVLREAVEFWGMAAANLVSLFNPEKIIFGGGVFGPATQFLEDIRLEAMKWAQPISIGQVKLVPSVLGSDAAVTGAGFLALRSLTRE